MQKPLRELSRLCFGASSQTRQTVAATDVCIEFRRGLPVLQVWPSESPRRDANNQEFVFPDTQDNVTDSGIESIQASPSGNTGTTAAISTSPSITPQHSRRTSILLHPDHARLNRHFHVVHNNEKSGGSRDTGGMCGSPDRTSIDEERQALSPASSTTSSLRSMPSSTMTSIHERRRSSRYSMFDALDLEYALLRAAARGSVGPYSLSESLHKLTFTQSLAFPGLARGLALKQNGIQSRSRQSQQHGESGMNAFAKIITALVLVLVSVLVFGVVYKFVRT
ncbi:PREDICTED: uncharacterized protein LOC105368418 [Ceratosolen solmsi marchali]|uniref:Uncharacterized protein LOC105368418 n=1 Tax=Ceratosolen solmsi marchali TaxID=326594 RepID=A0AAJ6YWP1_9HYME|nr:PREDICTED: uncharacterized protein LOC105368418 [Ceratosolen solmsi marchali]